MSFEQINNKNALKAPFVYFGGKGLIATKIWELLGNPEHYLEPFTGSCAVLLARPNGSNLPVNFSETVNDKDGLIANVWRALKYDPEGTAHYADDPIIHVDLMAKKKYILDHQPELLAKMSADPEYYDVRMAGYYIWASSCWIGKGLTQNNGIPHLSGQGQGIYMTQISHLGDKGIGIHKTQISNIESWFKALQNRLKRVRIVNGDWTQILGGDWQGQSWNSVGMYFDPPYSEKANRDKRVYNEDSLDVAHDVREYLIKTNKKHPDWRLILSGYYEEHLELLDEGYDFISWKAKGGYANTSKKDTQGKTNRKRECLFFNKACLNNKMFGN